MSRTKVVMICVSVGELIDKITILEIKVAKIQEGTRLDNVKKELEMLMIILHNEVSMDKDMKQLMRELKEVNERLWQAEDNIRLHEETGNFDEDFIMIARSIYLNNDIRASIKRKINEISNSNIIEEKNYPHYKNTNY